MSFGSALVAYSLSYVPSHLRPPFLTIRLDVVPDTATNFQFGGTLGAFKLDDTTINDRDVYTNHITFEVSPGNYTVSQTIPTGYFLTAIQCPATVSTTVQLALSQVTIAAKVGDQLTCTFVNERAAQVMAYKYHDLNGSGLKSLDEPYLAGWKMTLTDTVGVKPPRLTSQGGLATFTTVRPGSFTLCETQQPGWRNTYPGAQGVGGLPCVTHIVAPGRTVIVRFGNQSTSNPLLSAANELPATEEWDSPDDEGETADPDGRSTTIYLPAIMR